MAEIEIEGYRGVTYMYNHTTKHVIVRWIEDDVDQRVKDGIESLLMNILKQKSQPIIDSHIADLFTGW